MCTHGFVSRRLLPILLGCTLSGVVIVRDAGAQPAWEDRAFVSVNSMLTLTSATLEDRAAPVIYAERAVLTTTHPGLEGISIEPTGGLRLWRNLGIAGTLSRRTVAETPTVRAIVPHPVLFNQPRLASAPGAFERADTAVHAQVVFMMPLTPRLDVAVSGGPSLVSVRQDILRTVAVAEAGPPFTTVALGDVSSLTRTARTVGMNAAVDATWFVTPMAGVGITARYVRGFARMTLTDGTPVDVNVGGLQIGVGARVRFR